MKHDIIAHADNLNPSLPITLAALPFDVNKFEPNISAETFRFHHGQHHKAYVDKVNILMESTDELQATTLEQLLNEIQGSQAHLSLYNNALQCWNHQFQWLSLTEITDITLFDTINSKIKETYISFDAFIADAVTKSMAHFGSGWLWLIAEDGAIKLLTTHDAERPKFPTSAILVLDLWEHAYYLDHQNRKNEYIEAVIRHHWNWSFAEKRLSQAE
jgi:superoxide dismutase, Fe-Mn family